MTWNILLHPKHEMPWTCNGTDLRWSPNGFVSFLEEVTLKGGFKLVASSAFCVNGCGCIRRLCSRSLVTFYCSNILPWNDQFIFSWDSPHELGHGTVFKNKWLNKLFLYLFSLLSWWNPFDYASSHTYHHRYTLHPEGDRENLLPLHPKVGKTFLLQLFTINLFTLPEIGRASCRERV